MTIILDNYPPSTLQGVGLGDRKNPRIIVGENYCHFGAAYYKKHLLLKNLLRTLLRSVRLHDPLGVHPNQGNSGTL